MAANLVIVFVPGGMGTTLSLDGVKVWDFDSNLLSLNLDGVRMLTNPALLLPWLPLEPGSLLSVYNDLIGFFHAKGYHEQAGNPNLYLFGYDWRQGLPAVASQLAQLVNTTIVPNLAGRKVLFIVHSYGCMVTRWALTVPTPLTTSPPLIDNSFVQGLIAAGPPMLGMASAFRDMVQTPSLSNALDAIWSFLETHSPSIANQFSVPLCKAAATVNGELEGIPLNTFKILTTIGSSTGPYGAFEWAGWPDSLKELLLTVQSNLQQLGANNWGPFQPQIIASKATPTDTGYNLNPDHSFNSAWPTGPGDGSILFTSASAYGSFPPLVVTQPHESLLDDPASRAFLQGQI